MKLTLTETMEMVNQINKLQREICPGHGVVLKVTFREDGQMIQVGGDYERLKQLMIETWGEDLAFRALDEAEDSMLCGSCKVFFYFTGYPEKVSFSFRVEPWELRWE